MISCVDNDSARLAIAAMAAKLLRVHLDLGTLVQRTVDQPDNPDRQIGADIRLMLPGSCLACVGGLQPTTDETTVVRSGEHSGDVRDWQSGGRAGSLLSINHLAVGAAIQIWLDLLAEKINSSFWQRIQWQQGRGLETASSAVVGDPKCRVCHFS